MIMLIVCTLRLVLLPSRSIAQIEIPWMQQISWFGPNPQFSSNNSADSWQVPHFSPHILWFSAAIACAHFREFFRKFPLGQTPDKKLFLGTLLEDWSPYISWCKFSFDWKSSFLVGKPVDWSIYMCKIPPERPVSPIRPSLTSCQGRDWLYPRMTLSQSVMPYCTADACSTPSEMYATVPTLLTRDRTNPEFCRVCTTPGSWPLVGVRDARTVFVGWVLFHVALNAASRTRPSAPPHLKRRGGRGALAGFYLPHREWHFNRTLSLIFYYRIAGV